LNFEPGAADLQLLTVTIRTLTPDAGIEVPSVSTDGLTATLLVPPMTVAAGKNVGFDLQAALSGAELPVSCYLELRSWRTQPNTQPAVHQAPSPTPAATLQPPSTATPTAATPPTARPAPTQPLRPPATSTRAPSGSPPAPLRVPTFSLPTYSPPMPLERPTISPLQPR
jgi:hypothetical protein